MNAMLPDDVQRKLATCAERERWLRWTYNAALGLGALLLLASLAMTADWLFVWFAPAARWASNLVVLGVLLGMGYVIITRQRRHTLVDTARAAEAQLPDLEERWSTLAALDSPKVPESMRGAPGLRARVRAEASALSGAVSPTTAVPMRPWLARAACWLGGGVAIMLVLVLVDADHVGVLWRRLMVPWRDISLTHVDLMSTQQVIPRNEPFTLAARLSGRLSPQAQLIISDAQAGRRVLTLLPGSDAPDQLSHFIKSPMHDFGFTFRAGDGQTAWQRVKVADRPVLRAVSSVLKSPSVTQSAPRRQQGLPSKLRAVEGSTLEVRFESDVVLERLELCRSPDGAAPLTPLLLERRDGAYVFTEKLTRSFRFYPVLVSAEGLTNLAPPVCQVEVVPDQKPVLVFTEECTKSALTAEDTVRLAFRADDDFGIDKVEARVLLENPGKPRQEQPLTLPETVVPGAMWFAQNVPVKLADLPVTPDTLVAFAVEVTDTSGSVTREVRRLPIDEFAKEPEAGVSIKALLAIQPAMEMIIVALEQARQQAQNAQSAPQAMDALQAALAQSEALQKATKEGPMKATAEVLKRIAEEHMQPAQTALAQPNKDLQQAQQHIDSALQQMRQATAEAGKQARQQAAAELASQLQKMHQLVLAGLPNLPRGTTMQDLLNRKGMDTVEADEATLKALRERLELIRGLLKQFAMLLEQDPGLRARFLDAQSKYAHNLRDQLHLLAQDQEMQTRATDLAASDPNGFAGFDARAQQQQKAVLDDLATSQLKAVTWMLKKDGKPDAAADEFLLHLRAASTRTVNDGARLLADLEQARKSLNALALKDGFGEYSLRRMTELEALLQQQTWLLSVQEARSKNLLAEVASLHQRSLWRTASQLGAKITDAAIRFETLGPQMKPLIDRLITSLRDEAVPAQDDATTQLHFAAWAAAATAQRSASEGLAKAEAAYDALLQAITDQFNAMPPGPPGNCTPSLEKLLALLENELAEHDDFGLASRQLNVQMNADWPSLCKSCACPKPTPQTAGSSSSKSSNASFVSAAAAQSERERAMARAALRARRDILAEAAKTGSVASADSASGPSDRQRRLDWNQLPSELQKDLRQQRDVPPPEEYRRAVEGYFRRLALEK